MWSVQLAIVCSVESSARRTRRSVYRPLISDDIGLTDIEELWERFLHACRPIRIRCANVRSGERCVLFGVRNMTSVGKFERRTMGSASNANALMRRNDFDIIMYDICVALHEITGSYIKGADGEKYSSRLRR